MVKEFLFEQFYTGTTGVDTAYGVNWRATTFTIGTVGAKASHYATSIGWRGYRTGSPGTVTFSLRKTDSLGKPTGPDLIFLQFNGNNLTTGSVDYVFEWFNFIPLLVNIKYALAIRAPSGDAANLINWRQTSPGTYAGGEYLYSDDSGATWTAQTIDAYFKDFGIPIGDPLLLHGIPHMDNGLGLKRHPRSRIY